MVEIDFFKAKWLICSTEREKAMQMSVCVCVYVCLCECMKNPRRSLVVGKERKTNLTLVENPGPAICKLCDFEAHVLVTT